MAEAERKNSELDLTGLMEDGLRELIELVGSSGVTELQIERGDTRLYIKSAGAETAAPEAAPVAAATQPAVAPAQAPEPAVTGTPITSPIVGTFYGSPSPGSEPFVRVGDHVEVGQTVAIVEAMKIMNEIEAEVAGRVTEILAQNGQAVEYGQPLMLIDSSARPA